MADDDQRVLVLPPGAGAVVRNPVGGELTFKVRGEDTRGTMVAFESVAAPGEGPPLHVHSDADEIWLALEGTFRFKSDNGIADAPPGTFVWIPRGAAHTWQKSSDGPGRFFAALAPAGLERFFDRYADVEGLSGTEAFERLGGAGGMEVVGPPLSVSDPLP